MQIVRPLPLVYADYTVNIAEDEAPAWLVGTTYALGDQVVYENRVWVSTIAGNIGNDPTLENQELTSARWLLIGNTNAYSFMDQTIGNKTTNGSTTVTIDVANAAGATAVLFFGMQASTIQVEAFDAMASTVYDTTTSLSGRDVFDYYAWFTEDIGEVSLKLALTDLPTTVDNLTITVSGNDIEIGEIVIGDVIVVGNALLGQGTEGEVKSYSRYEFNAYGRLTRISGPTRNIMRYTVQAPAPSFPIIKDRMDNLAGEVVAAIGASNRPTTIQYGILGTIKWPENLVNDYIYKFQLDGVT